MDILRNNYLENNLSEKTINYFIIFLTIFLSSSFYALSIPGNINLVLTFSVALLSVLINRKHVSININSLFFVFFIIISSLFTLISNGESIFNYFIFWVYLISAYLVFISIGFLEFLNKYIKIMYFISLYSLITFLILYIYPDYISYFPTVRNTANLEVHNLFFTVAHNSSYIKSNFGLFWEPGAFQTFLNLALFMELFISKKTSTKRVIVFILTVITTFSTTGYIGTFLIMIIYLYKKKNIIYKSMKNKVFYLFMFLLILIGYQWLPNYIKFKVFGKLQFLFSPHNVLEVDYTSTEVRINAIKYPFEAYLKNPFFGIGFDNLYQQSLDNAYLMITCTPINWFALFGTFTGLLFNFCLYKWTNVVATGIISKFLIFIFLLIIVISENYNRNMFFFIILFYGFIITKKEKTI